MTVRTKRDSDTLNIIVRDGLEIAAPFKLESVSEKKNVRTWKLFSAQKIMNKQSSMIVTNPNRFVMNIFEITGFIDLLTIK